MAKQLYWNGPGVYGFGEKVLKPGDPIPKDWSKENFIRFKNKIGEKIEVGVIEDTAELKTEIKKLRTEIKDLEKQNIELLEQIEKKENGGK